MKEASNIKTPSEFIRINNIISKGYKLTMTLDSELNVIIGEKIKH